MVAEFARSSHGGVIAGVASGIADFIGVPSFIVRACFMFAACVLGIGVIVYLLLWVFIPSSGQSRTALPSWQSQFVRECENLLSPIQNICMKMRTYRTLISLLFLFTGSVLLAVFIFPQWQLERFLPVVLVFVGVAIVWMGWRLKIREEEKNT